MSPYKGSDLAAPPAASVRYFKISRHDLVYLKFILEAYEGMSTLSTVAPKEGIVRLSIPGGFEEDIDHLLAAIGAAISVHEVTFTAKDAEHA